MGWYRDEQMFRDQVASRHGHERGQEAALSTVADALGAELEDVVKLVDATVNIRQKAEVTARVIMQATVQNEVLQARVDTLLGDDVEAITTDFMEHQSIKAPENVLYAYNSAAYKFTAKDDGQTVVEYGGTYWGGSDLWGYDKEPRELNGAWVQEHLVALGCEREEAFCGQIATAIEVQVVTAAQEGVGSAE